MTRDTIIYIGGFKLPDKNAAAQRVLNNAKILKSIGYEVILVGVSDDLTLASEPEQTRCEGFKTVNYSYPLGIKNWLNYTAGKNSIVELVTSIGASLHSVICYNYPALASKRIFSAAKDVGAVSISDITEWYATDTTNLRGIVKTADTYARMKHIGPSSNAIITTSPFMFDYYKSLNKPQVNLPTLYDVDKIDALGFKYIVSKARRTFVYAGSPGTVTGPEKGFSKDRLDLIIEVLGKLEEYADNFLLKIYGLDEENYRKAMPKHGGILDKLSGSLEFMGRRPHAEILQAFSEADFTTFIRTEDRLTLAGFPSKFAESISCGTPVVCSAVANLGIYMREEINSFEIDPLDIAQAASVFKHCIEMQDADLNKMHVNCQESRQFDYRNYKAEVSIFINALNKEYEIA